MPLWYLLSTGNELGLPLGFQNSAGSMWQGYQKKVYFDQWQCGTKVYNKQLPNCLKRVKTSVVPIAFDGVLCEVLAYTVAFFFLYLGIKWNRYQKKLYLGQWPYSCITKNYPVNAICLLNYCRIKVYNIPGRYKYITRFFLIYLVLK